jgi:asparagine synthase (glutamine-hydrolysing)
MCGIVVGILQGRSNPTNLSRTCAVAKAAFDTSNVRGPEESRFESYAGGGCNFGMHRLEINGPGTNNGQPLRHGSSVLVCNGEIYNHKTLSRDSDVAPATESDCESILLALRDTTIKSALSGLDGVFALCVYNEDTKELLVARDTFGVRPLYTGSVSLEGGGKITLFASELQHLAECSAGTVRQFPPGYYRRYTFTSEYGFERVEDGCFRALPSCALSDTAPAVGMCMANIRNALEDAVWKRTQNTDRPIACLLSGGLDSTIVASCAAKCIAPAKLKTFSIGMAGSPDLEFARTASEYIGTDHTEVLCTEEQFIQAIPVVIKAIGTYDTTSVRASVGNYLIAQYIATRTDCKVVLNGDGADEVAGGYVYFRAAPSPSAFDFECRRLLNDMHMFDIIRSEACMGAWGLEARTPFLDPAFVSMYLSAPVLERVPQQGTIEKGLLRSAFKDMIPPQVYSRKKEAFSDGVTTYQRSWQQIIFERLSSIGPPDLAVRDACPNPPHTREMAVYRTLFEKYYPNRGHLIPYMWMPKWVHATDASARTLDIY